MTYALRLNIRLEEPLLATAVANGEENSSISLDYIPGSALRGACAAAYSNGRDTDDFAADPLARRLFFNGEVCFLNGYPALPTNTTQRALPCPLSWHMDKDDSDNEQREVRDYVFEEVEKFDKSKGEGRAFFWPSEDEPRLLQSPHRWTNVHNATIADPMRKNEESSNVFRYEALARGQDFVAYVVAEDKSLIDKLEEYLPSGQLHLGGSQTAGYGLVKLTTARENNWRESERDHEVEDWTIITLLSDAVLRDEHGRATTDFHEALCLALDKTISTPKKSFAQTRLVGGFNRKWGLPLPQRWAVAMGSTFVYTNNDLTVSELKNLLEDGIGDRRGEGLGRIGVNLNGKAEFATAKPQAATIATQILSAASAELAQTMAQRRLMLAVANAILDHIQAIDFEKDRSGKARLPQNTQLSRMRLAVQQAQRDKNLGLIHKHLDTMKKPAAGQFNDKLLDVPGEPHPVTWERWLRDRARKNDGLNLIGLNPAEVRWQIAGWPPVIGDTLQIEVTCGLIGALLRKALKEEK